MQTLESVLGWIGGFFACFILGLVLYGVWRGTKRQAGRTTGLNGSWLRSPWFYFASCVLFFSVAYFGWKPLPWVGSQSARVWMLAVGSLLYFPAMSFIVWARISLGKNYFVSTGFGAQLFKDHQLVTSGPFAIVRHPMYVGLIVAAIGALLIYFTWTTLYFACFAPLTAFRARREEYALSQEFGETWREYCHRVPAFFPKLSRRS